MRFTLTPDTDASAGDGASAVIVDWLGAGRIASGERWAFDEYASRFEFVWEEDASEGTSGGKVKRPRLVEAVRLRRDDCNFLDHPLQSFDAFVTIFACDRKPEEWYAEPKQSRCYSPLEQAHGLGLKRPVNLEETILAMCRCRRRKVKRSWE